MNNIKIKPNTINPSIDPNKDSTIIDFYELIIKRDVLSQSPHGLNFYKFSFS